MLIWVIHYNGSPDLKEFDRTAKTRKIRCYETENIAWRSAERIFKDYPKEVWENIEIVPYKPSE